MMQMLSITGGVSSGVYLIVTCIQIKVYGFRRWIRTGAGTGILRKELEEEERKFR